MCLWLSKRYTPLIDMLNLTDSSLLGELMCVPWLKMLLSLGRPRSWIFLPGPHSHCGEQ